MAKKIRTDAEADAELRRIVGRFLKLTGRTVGHLSAVAKCGYLTTHRAITGRGRIHEAVFNRIAHSLPFMVRRWVR